MTEIAPRRSSLQDVAKLAGVSTAAVSYVVNGRTSEVGETTRLKIERAIKELSYRPHRRGLSLKFNREFAIGLVVIDGNPNFLADPFTTQVAAGLSDVLGERGYGLTVSGCRSDAQLDSLLRRPIGVDAFVVIASGAQASRVRAYDELSGTRLPLAVIQEEPPARVADGCGFVQDDFGGGAALARHLLASGARRLAFISPARDWPAIDRRRAGVKSALFRATRLEEVRCDEHDFAETVAVIRGAIAHSGMPDAIVGANDQIAMAALKVLSDVGMDVPGQVQVTGFNAFPFRGYVRPLLTTVRSSADGIGRACAQAILARLEGTAFPERSLTLPVSFEPGGTTRTPADLA